MPCCDTAKHDGFYPFCDPEGVSEIQLHDVNATVDEGMVDLFCIVRFMAVEHFGCFQNGFPSSSCSLFCDRLFATSRDETFSEQVYQKLLWQPVLVSTLEPYKFISFLRPAFFFSHHD